MIPGKPNGRGRAAAALREPKGFRFAAARYLSKRQAPKSAIFGSYPPPCGLIVPYEHW
jgi:hypothetical protein